MTDTACTREPGTECAHCGARKYEDCPLADMTPGLLVTPPIGGVQGTCNPDEGVCESCQ